MFYIFISKLKMKKKTPDDILVWVIPTRGSLSPRLPSVHPFSKLSEGGGDKLWRLPLQEQQLITCWGGGSHLTKTNRRCCPEHFIYFTVALRVKTWHFTNHDNISQKTRHLKKTHFTKHNISTAFFSMFILREILLCFVKCCVFTLMATIHDSVPHKPSCCP